MARLRSYPARETLLSKAVVSVRKRLNLTQMEFEFLLLGRHGNCNVSRWENGKRRPGIIALMALLKLVETPEDRAPIIEALKSQGTQERIERLRNILASNHSVALPTVSVSGEASQTAMSISGVAADKGNA